MEASPQPPPSLTEIATTAAQWAAEGRPALVVRTVSATELGPPTRDDVLLLGADGERAGTLVRGAIDEMLDNLARAHLAGPSADQAARHTIDVPFEAATARGLTCGGAVDILLQPLAALPAALWHTLAAGEPAVLVTDLAPGPSRTLAVGPDLVPIGTLGRPELDRAATTEAVEVLATPGRGTARCQLAGQPVLVELWHPAPHLVLVGAAALAEALTALAAQLGWQATTTTEAADSLAAIDQLGAHDMIVVLEHRSSIATPALATALRRGVGYVGALGSRRIQTARREALAAAGVNSQELAALHGPTGLDLGARTPVETAISIVAEILATRSGRVPAPLGHTATPISG